MSGYESVTSGAASLVMVKTAISPEEKASRRRSLMKREMVTSAVVAAESACGVQWAKGNEKGGSDMVAVSRSWGGSCRADGLCGRKLPYAVRWAWQGVGRRGILAGVVEADDVISLGWAAQASETSDFEIRANSECGSVSRSGADDQNNIKLW